MTTLYQDRPLAAPIIDAATAPFWRAAAEGSLLIKHCPACGQTHWYPRSLCPYCMSDALEWQPACGLGTIYSVSVTRAANPAPYAIAYVRLDEGVTMLSNIVDCDLDTLRIGDRVKVCFKAAEGGHAIPMFTPA
ncbi:DNA-binding protein [Variovorax paradoxus]|uniref:DNA-binding protein n=1 Tax=Variovorax paradoxus TaxID=34073 RepID=A0A5Q0M5C6_VARPD|nr:Zn-ribbon domain-containing OB-fold protein [Variovorax paradoxus]QFZ84007.1 DNA-binding protein [Variovorax paradoxus]